MNDMKEKLSAAFDAKDIEWRVGQCGFKKDGQPWAIVLPYVDARAVMNRLDDVAGIENWEDDYEHIYDAKNNLLGVKAKIRIKLGGDWIAKVDGSQETDLESFKGGFSKSFVRCAVKWGIGRYLYDAPITFAEFVNYKSDNTVTSKIKDKTGKEEWCTWVKPNVDAASNSKKIEQSLIKAGVREIEKTFPDSKLSEVAALCSLCKTTMMKSKNNSFLYCPNFRDRTKGEHQTIKL